MPTIRRTTVLAANATVNPLQGSQYEYLPFNAMVEIACLAIADSVAQASIFSGTDVLLQNETIDGLALANPVIYPDHYEIQDVGAMGERLGVSVTDISGAGTTVRTVVRITPV